jgi:tRNA pseudouridine38-40 synthase
VPAVLRTVPSAPRTVQGVLEDALAQILQKPTPLLAAGRTDSGVHAVGQVIAFGADWDRPLADLHRALNAVLAHDVAVRALSVAPPGFHPRYDARRRTYCYTIWNHPLRSPLSRRSALWVRQPLDLAAMAEAARLLVGSQDFATFGTAPRTRSGDKEACDEARSGQPSTVRHVVRAAWSRVDDPPGARLATWQQTLMDSVPDGGTPDDRSVRWQGFVEFTIEANAFLYHMVRSIVGTLLQVGRGDLSVSEFASALAGADRALAGPTAAPHGLCLVDIQYAAGPAHRPAAGHRADGQREENQ